MFLKAGIVLLGFFLTQTQIWASIKTTGHIVEIVRRRSNGELVYKEDALKQILMDDDIKDREITLVLIGPTVRDQKFNYFKYASESETVISFFNNMVIPDIENPTPEWVPLYLRAQKPYRARRRSRITFCDRTGKQQEGIYIWKRLIKYNLVNGRKIAFGLIEARVDWDKDQTNALLLHLGLLVSSTYVYPLSSGNITDFDLQKLVNITKYVKVDESRPPIQNLLVLIRNASRKGIRYLDEVLKVGENTPASQKLADIRSKFGTLSAFLLAPDPKPLVIEEQNDSSTEYTFPNFTCNMFRVNGFFHEQFGDLIEYLLSPQEQKPLYLKTRYLKEREKPMSTLELLDTFQSSFQMIKNMTNKIY